MTALGIFALLRARGNTKHEIKVRSKQYIIWKKEFFSKGINFDDFNILELSNDFLIKRQI